MFRVVLTDMISDDLAPEREVLGDIATFDPVNAATPQQFAGRIDDADAVIVFNLLFAADSIRTLTKCRGIVRGGVGYDNIDIAAARACGIPVMNTPDYGTEEVADAALAMALSLVRGTHRYSSILRQSPAADWSYKIAAPLVRLRGRTFGIIGLGRIGTAAALRAKAFGFDVLFFDPFKPDGYDKALGIRRAERLEDLLSVAHVVSLHCPLTPQTESLIDANAIRRMPAGSYLVNTGRGRLVDLAAVADAIRIGHLAGAGIDVFPDEPPADDHPLVAAWRDPAHPAHDRVIISPHAAFYCEEGLREIRVKAARSVRRVLLGEPLRNVVN